MGAYNSTAKTRVEGELHPSRDGRVWSVAQQTYITPGQTPGAASPTKPAGAQTAAIKTYDQSPPIAAMTPLPSATKQTAGVAGAGMGTGGKTYDSGTGAGGVKGMGDSPMKPVNTFRPGSLQWQRWEDTYNPKPAAPVAPVAPTPEAPPIEGAMTAAQMDAMQAKPETRVSDKFTGIEGPQQTSTLFGPGHNEPLTQQTYTDKLNQLQTAGDTAGVTALNDRWAKDAQAALSKPATTPETVQAAAVAAVNPEAALAPLPTVTSTENPVDGWKSTIGYKNWDASQFGNYDSDTNGNFIDMRTGRRLAPGDQGYDEAKIESMAAHDEWFKKHPQLPIGEYKKTLDRSAYSKIDTSNFDQRMMEALRSSTKNSGIVPRFDQIRYAGGTPSFNESGVQIQNALPPLPSTVKPQEQLIADQDPNNPISNWQAIGRAVGAEYSPFTYSAADIANEARGFGLDRYLNPEQLAEEQIRLQGQQLDEKERRDMEDLRNRNGGIGISGNRLRREMEVANQYGLDKALMQNDVRRQARAEGLNANLMVQGNARNVLGDRAAQQEGRFGTMLNSALRQSDQQTGIVQNERGRAWQGNENATQRQWQTGETQAQRVHDAAVKDAENNQATRGMYTQILAPMLLDMINPKPKSPQDAWYEAQLAKEGVNVGGYDQFSQGGIPGLLNTILSGGGLEQILTAIPALQGLLQGGGY